MAYRAEFISERWSKMTEDQKFPYVGLANFDKIRYQNEVDSLEKKGAALAKLKKEAEIASRKKIAEENIASLQVKIDALRTEISTGRE